MLDTFDAFCIQLRGCVRGEQRLGFSAKLFWFGWVMTRLCPLGHDVPIFLYFFLDVTWHWYVHSANFVIPIKVNPTVQVPRPIFNKGIILFSLHSNASRCPCWRIWLQNCWLPGWTWSFLSHSTPQAGGMCTFVIPKRCKFAAEMFVYWMPACGNPHTALLISN